MYGHVRENCCVSVGRLSSTTLLPPYFSDGCGTVQTSLEGHRICRLKHGFVLYNSLSMYKRIYHLLFHMSQLCARYVTNGVDTCLTVLSYTTLLSREYLLGIYSNLLTELVYLYDGSIKGPLHAIVITRLMLLRHLIRKHDYIIYYLRALSQPEVVDIYLFLCYAHPLVAIDVFVSSHLVSLTFRKASAVYIHNFTVCTDSFVMYTITANPFTDFKSVIHLHCRSITRWYNYYKYVYVPLNTHIGGSSKYLRYSELIPFISDRINVAHSSDALFKLVDIMDNNYLTHYKDSGVDCITCHVPLDLIIDQLTHAQLRRVAKFCNIHMSAKTLKHTMTDTIRLYSRNQSCTILSRFKLNKSMSGAERQTKHRNKHSAQKRPSNKSSVKSGTILFPPKPPTDKIKHNIIKGFCMDTDPNQLCESGCAVCGELHVTRSMVSLDAADVDLDVLQIFGVSRKERFTIEDPIESFTHPIVAPNCRMICSSCYSYIVKGVIPPTAIANGLWLGEVPLVLKNLTYVEKLLIARVRHNRCVITVASGRKKMRANAVTFANPTPKIYDILPPPLDELDDVLAFVFTGPCLPTKQELDRCPLLVRRKNVGQALHWLHLNHVDYADMIISEDNLNEYPDCDVPVTIDYRKMDTNKLPEATSVHDNEEEEGVESGDCPFVVHGLTGEEFSTMRLHAIKAVALQHLMSGEKILYVGHSEHLQSIYQNPQLFPSMFPWLFPYGLGGIGNYLNTSKLSSMAHKKHLLMYYDKRFQLDPDFALIAFNHEQIQDSVRGGYLTTEKANFKDTAERILNVNTDVLKDISGRLLKGERVKPCTKAEIDCYKLISDLDVVGSNVKGSITSKKHMRNEIWSLISHVGSPSWFITLSPADNKHPLCLYFADTKEEFKPDVVLPDDAYRLISQNPVAAARFFNVMCNAFIKHVLGVGSDHCGLYGDTAAYYGTVEQQGRLTLHLHLLLWIKNALTPQEIRDKIMDVSSDFRTCMVEYLESVHKGELFNGTLSEVRDKVRNESDSNTEYIDPTRTLPIPPPPRCKKRVCGGCSRCRTLKDWWTRFRTVVDDLVSRYNFHTCSIPSTSEDGTIKKKGCLNSKGQCKARFPREIVEETMVDPLTGALKIKKTEGWINTYTPTVSYLIRSNTDVTSLLSGTAVKAVVAYISDYVSKPGLKTYTIFNAIRDVFQDNSELLNNGSDKKTTARSLMVKIVNRLTSKMELGSPMASLYMLGHPDHYTNMTFKVFY